MKTFVAFLVLLLLAGVVAQAEMKIVRVRGDVKVRHGAQEDWRTASPGDVLKPKDSMKSGRGASVVLTVDGSTRLSLPEMVIVDCSDLRTLTQEELLLKLAMEGIRALPPQKRGEELSVPRTTTVHGEGAKTDVVLQPGSKEDYALQLNGTKVLYEHGFYATMVLRAKEVFRLAPELKKRTDIRLMVADAFEQMKLTGDALAEYRELAKEKLAPKERKMVDGKIEELRKKQTD